MANESNSSVVRVHKNTDFTIMSNHHLRNQKLSLKAIGLMSKILGLPCDWNYSIAGLVKICKEGETAVRAALHELIDERYVYLEKLPPNYSKSGRYADVPNTEKQDAENLYLENQDVENQGQLNTYISSTKESNMKELNGTASAPPKKKADKKKYAEAVTMTEEEYQKLMTQHSRVFVDKCIEILNNYKLSSGKRYKSDYHTILNWVIERVSKDYPQLDKPPAQSSAYDVNVNPFDQFVR